MSTKIGIYEKAFPKDFTLEQIFFEAKNYGYDFVEICIDTDPTKYERLNWSDDKWETLISLSEKYNLDLLTLSLSYLRLHPLGLLDENRNKIAISAVEQTLHIAKILGIKTILINTYDVYDQPSNEQTFNRMIDNFKKIAVMAENEKIVIALENAEMEVGNSISKVGKIVETVNSSFIKIYADIGNATNSYDGITDKVIDDFDKYKDQIVAVHIKDNLPGQFRNVEFGKGRVDFKSILNHIKDFPIETYVFEYFNRSEWKSDLDSIKCLFAKMI